MLTGRGPCPEFGIGSLKSAQNVGNINTAKSLQKKRKQFSSKRKGSPSLRAGSYMDYTSLL